MGGLSRMGKLEGRSSPHGRLPRTAALKGEDARPERSDDGRVAAISGAVPQEGQTTHPEAGDRIPPTVEGEWPTSAG